MASLQISISFPAFRSFGSDLGGKKCYLGCALLPPIRVCSFPSGKTRFCPRNGCRMSAERRYFSAGGLEKDGTPTRKKKARSLVVVRANEGFGFNGDGGGGGWDKNTTGRVLGNLAVAGGLTYLSMTGQLGWILDAIVSIWLLAVLLPVVGLGAFLWFAGRDIVQDSCPNCGNDFQILKSSLKDGVQLCPFCTQPFSVQDNKFVRESARFSSNRSTPFGQVFNGFSSRSEKGKGSSTVVVDIEAEVKDID